MSGTARAADGSLAGEPGESPTSAPTLGQSAKRLVTIEIIIVLAISFGRSAVSSILSLIEKLTRNVPLSEQTTSMNNSVTPDRPWLDLAYQLYYYILPLAETALALYLLHLAFGHARRLIGFDLTRPGPDLAKGAGFCVAVGIPGIGFYLLAREIGINTTVAPANLTDVWWTVPVLLGSAAMSGISEEVVMLGYLLTRLKNLGWSPVVAIIVSALIRGSYHLYQGYGGFIGNLAMGVVFGFLYLRWKRVMPLVIAHTLIDCFAFVGYSLIAPYVSWL
ncbi:MAG: CPBP family intramembrane metalloprotease [Propionibacteriaceae bacterium]|jgi:membrane protease YdiL (CAAX protease family)|nr:CPBP family intramembrane metalloprotease [Propionibacteriaceae bacterium]